MSSIFINVAAIFILILIGWAMARSRLLKAEAGDALGEFVFKVAIPLLIFRTLAQAEFEGASPFGLWGAYFLGVTVAWTLGHLAATRLFGRDAKAGVITGLSASFANNVFIGMPLIAHIVGGEGLVALSILLAIHLPLMMVAGTILMEGAAARVDGTEKRGLAAVIRQVGSNLIRNPLVIGLLSGLAFNLSGLNPPMLATVVIDQLVAAASPLALVSIGMTLTRYPIRGDLGLSAVAAGIKLMVMPAMVLLGSRIFSLPGDWTAALVLTSSVPTGINAWLIAQRFRSGQALAASTIAITTAIGVVSVSFWAWLLT